MKDGATCAAETICDNATFLLQRQMSLLLQTCEPQNHEVTSVTGAECRKTQKHGILDP